MDSKELQQLINIGKRRCVCTEEYRCNTCRELETLKKQEEIKPETDALKIVK